MSGAGGPLVLVATPIGNLGDLSARAIDVLRRADVICCEDTRRTRALLSAAGVPAGGRLVSLHAHNEAARIPELLASLTDGRTVAVVSDAGTPGISDPGNRLVVAAAAAGFGVTVVPGPSAVLAALVVSGLPTDRFCVEGFLPRRGGERRARLEALVAARRTQVVLEAPGRLARTLAELAVLAPDRKVAVCRELTKVHEEVWRGTLEAAAARFAATQARGEVVIVIGGSPESHGASSVTAGDEALAAAVSARLAEGHSTRDAAAAASAELGVGHRRAYAAALAASRGEPPR